MEGHIATNSIPQQNNARNGCINGWNVERTNCKGCFTQALATLIADAY